ncbi:MAG: VUT family protein [Bacilli bacterium]|nr:VUT family protein [Bacilli bacterium]
MKNLRFSVRSFFKECFILLRSTPPVTLTLFVLSIVGMNLLANKSINTGLDWLALDCGIILSWLCFLSMDILTKHYGPKAAIIISIFALLVSLGISVIFLFGSLIPGVWSPFYDFGEQQVINQSLDSMFRGTWYIILGSSAAFIVSAVVNAIMNWSVGKIFKKNPDGFLAFATRTYVSTIIGQFVDNLVFALIVSMVFFGWSFLQCVTCALTGAIAELLFEIVFSPIGYRICRNLKKNEVGKPYFDYLAAKQSEAK